MNWLKENIASIMICIGMIFLIIADVYLIKENNVINFLLICLYSIITILLGILTLVSELGSNLKLKKIEEEQEILKMISNLKDEKNKVELLKNIIE